MTLSEARHARAFLYVFGYPLASFALNGVVYAVGKERDVVLAVVDGEPTCKILDLKGGQLLPANSHYLLISITNVESFVIVCVVISSVRYHNIF